MKEDAQRVDLEVWQPGLASCLVGYKHPQAPDTAIHGLFSCHVFSGTLHQSKLFLSEPLLSLCHGEAKLSRVHPQ